MADLESTLHYSLRVEATRAAALSGAQLATFKCYVATLVKVRSFWCWERNHQCLHVAIHRVKCKCRVQATTFQCSQVAKHGDLLCEPCVPVPLWGCPYPCGSPDSALSHNRQVPESF